MGLKPFDERHGAALSGLAIAQKLQMKYAQRRDAIIAIFPPPPVQGLGTIGGFKLQVEDRTDLGDAALAGVEGRAERLLGVDGFGARVDRPRPPPVARIRKTPAHPDDAPHARFGVPNDDRQRPADAIGDDGVVAALAR